MPATARCAEARFAVIGYLPEYRIANVTPEQLEPITDLVYFGLTPPADGRLPNSPVKPSVLQKLHQIKRVAKCRLLLTIGGWNRSEGFAALAKNNTARQRFIAALLAYCRDNGFDGVDYDWEHPENADELAAFGRLLVETKTAFQDTQLLVTVAQAEWQNLGKQAYGVVDRVHLMSYDHEFPQATVAKSKAGIDRLINWGCPAEKLALGAPFYGRNREGEARTYRELVAEHGPDANVDIVDGFAFNGRSTMAAKVRLAINRRLAGIMIWELGQDASRKEASLLATIDRQLRVSKQRTNK